MCYRVRFGYAHVANNYYDQWLMYAIGGSADPTIFSEGNYFIAPDSYDKEVCKYQATCSSVSRRSDIFTFFIAFPVWSFTFLRTTNLEISDEKTTYTNVIAIAIYRWSYISHDIYNRSPRGKLMKGDGRVGNGGPQKMCLWMEHILIHLDMEVLLQNTQEDNRLSLLKDR